MISEGSCDTEDWSIDDENHRNKVAMLKHSNRYFELTICHNIAVITVFLTNKRSLGEHKRLYIYKNNKNGGGGGS